MDSITASRMSSIIADIDVIIRSMQFLWEWFREYDAIYCKCMIEDDRTPELLKTPTAMHRRPLLLCSMLGRYSLLALMFWKFDIWSVRADMEVYTSALFFLNCCYLMVMQLYVFFWFPGGVFLHQCFQRRMRSLWRFEASLFRVCICLHFRIRKQAKYCKILVNIMEKLLKVKF